MNKKSILLNGMFYENPTFIGFLGMCPTLALTNSVFSAIGMGICVVFILTLSNLCISAVRNIVPDEVRIPVFIVIIATLVTILQMLIEAFVPPLQQALGLFIPLIVVNCIILGRAEAFAAKNSIIDSIFDGFGTGTGFLLALTALAIIRETLGAGTITILPKNFLGIVDGVIFDQPLQLMNSLNIAPIGFLVLPSGAFLTLGIIVAFINLMSTKHKNKKAKEVLA